MRKTQITLAPIPQEYFPYLKVGFLWVFEKILQNTGEWSFNSFELNEVTDGHALKYIGFELFNKYGFMDRFKVGKASNNIYSKPNSGFPRDGIPKIGQRGLPHMDYLRPPPRPAAACSIRLPSPPPNQHFYREPLTLKPKNF